MTTVAIVQARMGSTRLPGKVLSDLAGHTMLARVVQRLRAARTIDDIVIATTTATSDDAVVREAGRLGTRVHRGPVDNVLTRYLDAARAWRADVIVRVTADCPLLDPGVVDTVVTDLFARPVDYCSNTHTRTYPRGLDVEAMHRDTLDRLDRLGVSPAAREHVTSFIMQAPALFAVTQVRAVEDDSDLRWTVDTLDDLALVRTLYGRLDLGTTMAPYRDVVAAVRAMPELAAINAHIMQKPWEMRSVA